MSAFYRWGSGWSLGNSGSGDGPLTVEALRSELETFAERVFKEDLRKTVSEVLRSELPRVLRDFSADYDMVGLASNAADPFFENEDKMNSPRLRATVSWAAVKTATDWVTRRKVNPWYQKRNKMLQQKKKNLDAKAKARAENMAAAGSLRVSTQETLHRSYSRLPLLPLQERSSSALAASPSDASRHAEADARVDNEVSVEADEQQRMGDGLEREDGAAQVPPTFRRHSQQAAEVTAYMLNRRSSASLARESSRELVLMGEQDQVAPEDKNGAEMMETRRTQTTACFLESVVQSAHFEYISCSFVLANAICVGLQTDYTARHLNEKLPPIYSIIDHVFCVIFVTELIARVLVRGSGFFVGEGWAINLFDFVVVVFQATDEVLSLFFSSDNGIPSLSVMRNFGIIRFVRILRLTRVLAFIGELRTLVVSIASSLKSLVWVVILLVLLTYSFGVVLTQVVSGKKMQEGALLPEEEEELDKLFGTVSNSMLSLFEAVSEGTHWGEVMDPLVLYCSPWFKPIFLLYIVFAIFALLNVVTGLFVEAAIETAGEDKKVMIMQQMCQMFIDCDDDGSGTISREEFMHHLNKPEMESYLKELDIDRQEADMLFVLLDNDGSGEIEAEELVGGCLRLHGGAKALELAAFMHEFRNFGRRWKSHAIHVENVLASLCSAQKRNSQVAPIPSRSSGLTKYPSRLASIASAEDPG